MTTTVMLPSAIEGALRALLTDLRTQFGTYVTDVEKDITLSGTADLIELSEAPQVVLHGFRLPRSRFITPGSWYINEDRVAGTVDEVHYPRFYNLEFSVTAATPETWASLRMIEDLTTYFMGVLRVAYGAGAQAFTSDFGKEVVSEFVETTSPGLARLKVYLGKARISDIPVFDGYIEQRKLVTKFVAETVDGEGPDDSDPATIAGDLIDTITVNAEDA